MNLPNTLSISRIILSPAAFILMFLSGMPATWQWAAWIALWVLYLLAEISDLLDGYLARKLGMVSAEGKVLDPLSDVVFHTMVMLGLVQNSIIPLWFLVVFLFRELLTTGIRMVLLIEGTALPAGRGGKLKSTLLAVGCGFGILALGQTWGLFQGVEPFAGITTLALFGLGLLMSWISFGIYLRHFLLRKKTGAEAPV